MKKEYETPKMEIVDMAYCNKLLSGSGGPDAEIEVEIEDGTQDGGT